MTPAAQIAALVVEATTTGLAPIQTDVRAHAAALEAQRAELTAIRERLAVVEVRRAEPGPVGPAGPAGPAGAEGPAATEALAALERARGEIAALRERVAVVEVRAAEPGPPGAPGLAGADGLGIADLEIAYDGERGLTFRFQNGDRVIEKTIALPIPIYQGLYTPGRDYVRGDTVTFNRATWIAQAATAAKPGDGATAWRLAVMPGREGKPGAAGRPGADGRDGIDGRDLTGHGWAAPRG